VSGIAEVAREARSRPFPDRPAGWVNPDMAFEHLVVGMMENHSFDNLLGALSLTRPDIAGLTFENSKAANSNPGGPGMPPEVSAFALTATSQGSDISQYWKASHDHINGRAGGAFGVTYFIRYHTANGPL
jgi:phospholipase C